MKISPQEIAQAIVRLRRIGRSGPQILKDLEWVKKYLSFSQARIFLRQLLESNQLTRQNLKKIFKKEVSAWVLDLIYFLLRHRVEKLLPAIYTETQKILAEKQGLLEIEVTSALPLEASQKQKLQNILAKKFAKKIILKEKFDPEIIGGIQVKAGDWLFDDSIKNKISELSRRIEV